MTQSRAGAYREMLRRRMRRNRAKVITLLLIVGAIAWFLWPEAPELPPVPMTAPVTRGDIENTVAAAGTVQAGSMVDVGVRVTGQLTKLHVKLGDVVAKDELLAEIDDFIQQTRVASSQANLKQLLANTASQEASLGLSRGELRRQERLMKERATTEVDHDRAVVALTQAEAALVRHLLQIEQAEASLEEAKALLDFTRITAPADGAIVEILAEEGQTLNAMQSTPIILKIGDLSTVRVLAKIAEVDVARLKTGMEACFTTLMGGARRWSSHLAEISPLPSQGGFGAVVQFDALVEIENSDGMLMPGMTARVFFLTAAARNVLKVPMGALTFVGDAGPMSASQQFASRASGPERQGEAIFVGQGINDAATRESPAAIDQTSSPSMAQPPEADRHDPGDDVSRSAPRAAMVQVIRADGSRETRQVQVGVTNNVEAEVISGLSEGEMVVVGIPQPPMLERRFPGFLGG